MAGRAELEHLSPQQRRALRYDHQLLNDYATQVETRYKLPPGILNAIKNAGERSGATARSPKGALGVMQFMPGTQAEVGLKDATDPLESIDAAGRYIEKIMRVRGTADPALLMAAYNAGPYRRDITAGKIPKIKETQDYVKRGMDYMAANEKQPSKKKEGALNQVRSVMAPPDDTPAEAIDTFGDTLVIGDPFSGRRFDTRIPLGRGFNKFMAGAGKAVADTGRGLRQFMGTASQEEVDDAARRDMPLMNSGAGMAGYMGGKMAEGMLGGRALSAAVGPLAQMRNVQAMRNVPFFRRLSGPTATAAAGAGIHGATQPVMSGESRLGNASTAALLGGATTAGVGGVKRLGSAIGERITPAMQDALAFATKHGIPMRGHQLDKSGPVQLGYRLTGRLPMSGYDAANEAQLKAFTRAVGRTFGQDTDDLGVALAQARQAFSKVYGDIVNKYDIYLTQGHTSAMQKAIGTKKLGTEQGMRLKAWYDEMIQDYTANGGKLPGPLFQKHRDALYSLRASLDSTGRDAAKEASDQLNRAMKNSIIDPDDYNLWTRTDRLYNNFKTVDRLAKDAMKSDSDGVVDPAKLYDVMMRGGKDRFATQNRNAMITGNAGGEKRDLVELTKFGQEFLTPVARAEKAHLRKAAENAAGFSIAPIMAGGAGWGYGALTGHPDPMAAAALAAGATVLGGGTLGRNMNRPVNPPGTYDAMFRNLARDATRTAGIALEKGQAPKLAVAAGMAGKQRSGPEGYPAPAAGLGEPVPETSLPGVLGEPVPDDKLPTGG